MVTRIIIDEVHCVQIWGEGFRPPYKELQSLYTYLSLHAPHIQWYLTSATLDKKLLTSVLALLGMPRYSFLSSPKPTATLWLPRSNDRPNLHYIVRKMEYSATSCEDLGFLVKPGLSKADPLPDPFLVYCNSRSDTENVGRYLRNRVSKEMMDSIVWVHSGMSSRHRSESVQKFTRRDIIGIVCTDALGLVGVSDLFYAYLCDTDSILGHGSEECQTCRTVLSTGLVLFAGTTIRTWGTGYINSGHVHSCCSARILHC